MENRLETLVPTIILGKSMEMSFVKDKTQMLWQSFGPLVRTIQHRKDSNFISLQKFSSLFDPKNFDPHTPFTKWAGVALVAASTQEAIRDQNPELKAYLIQGGLYSVFSHVGPASEFRKSLEFIYGHWFPKSSYELDEREHFEVLPEGYLPDDPNAKEEIWIPIRKR